MGSWVVYCLLGWVIGLIECGRVECMAEGVNAGHNVISQ